MAWTERLASGRYRGVYRTSDGKRRSAGTFAHAPKAHAAATAAEEEAQRAGWRAPERGRITINEWHDLWWPSRRVERSTLRNDALRWTKHVQPRWGDVALDDVSRFDIREWAASLGKTGLTPATVQRCVALLSAALSSAVDDERLPANPAARLRLPQPDNQRERYLTRDEGSLLLDAFAGSDRAIVAFLLGTGVRWGELAGAAIEDYDAGAATYRVRQVHDQHTGDLRDYPKSKRRRTVPVPPWVAREIRPLIGTRKRGLIFRGTRGGPVSYRNWRARIFAPTVDDLDLEDVTIHTLRHTYASWLIQEGVSLAEVGRLLGHVSPMTTQRYAHLLDDVSDTVHAALRDPRAQGGTARRASGSR